jgi:murein DD-endopeptidase MepM/ murein hydrolase activator NlpD/Ca2+-binding RTX toxin-like protein
MPRSNRRARLSLECLEHREVPANLSVSNISLVDNGGNPFTTVAVGQLVDVHVTFKNTGGAAISPFFSTITIGSVTKTALCSVSPGADTGEFTINDFVPKLGTNFISVKLDSTNKIAETNESDNMLSKAFNPVTFSDAYTGETKLATPLMGTPNVNWKINNYLDLDSTDGGMLDYMGNTGNNAYTYDNHNGMDIGGANGFDTQHNGLPVLAAAGGVVIYANDGEFDEQTAKNNWMPGHAGGNGVEIDHGNGWVTEYYHMRTNSVSVKVGDYVSAGDILGLMGSSGNSTGTHLHFDVRYNGVLVEPYVAPNTYWVNPLPYAPTVNYNLQSYTDYHITENSGVAKFKVHRGPFDSDTWTFKTFDGSAVAGVNYQSTAGTVHFGVGDYDAWVDVPIINDDVREGPKTFGIEIDPVGSGSSSFQFWTIIDDEHLLNFNQQSGLLTINAATADLNDVVTLDVQGTNLQVTANNQTQLFSLNGPLGKVQSIVLNTGAGDDNITILHRPQDVGLLINAGDGNDVINLNTTQPGIGVVMNGGAGDDTFNVGKPSPNYLTMSLNGFLGDITADGGGGTNTLNVRGNSANDPGRGYTISSTSVDWGVADVAYSSIDAINLSTGNGTDGVAVTDGDLGKKISIDAGGGNDTLVGPSAVSNYWSIKAKNAGSVNFGEINFSGVENLTGGSNDDLFKFQQGGSLSGNLQGGGGNNGVSYANTAGPVDVNLQSGSATKIGGKFSGMTTFTGSSSSADHLTGPDSANLWHVGGNNGLTLNGNTTIWDFENLTGGSGSDTFTFIENGFVSGKVDGAGGSDTLDYSARQSGVSVDLAAKAASATGGFASIESVIGGLGDDTFAGAGFAAGINLWKITGLNKGTFVGNGNMAFDGFENLKGYSNMDWFIFADGAGVTGTIDGQGGSNWLDYSGYTAPVVVNVANQIATGTGKFTGIDLVIGGTASDKLIGTNGVNTWKITGKNAGTLNGKLTFKDFENLAGGFGPDTYTFADNAVLDGAITDSNESDNTLDYSAYTHGVTVNLATGQATGVAGGIQGIKNVIGGSGNDTLTGDAQNNVLKGNGGNDVLDGGDGSNLLLGGAGNDTITAGTGRDLLIGGAGQDQLSGGSGDDILIGDSTKYDNKTDVLLQMLYLWQQPEFDYSTRIGLLRNTGVGAGQNKLNTASIVPDAAKDSLAGTGDFDWFWALGSDTTDRMSVEVVN